MPDTSHLLRRNRGGFIFLLFWFVLVYYLARSTLCIVQQFWLGPIYHCKHQALRIACWIFSVRDPEKNVILPRSRVVSRTQCGKKEKRSKLQKSNYFRPVAVLQFTVYANGNGHPLCFSIGRVGTDQVGSIDRFWSVGRSIRPLDGALRLPPPSPPPQPSLSASQDPVMFCGTVRENLDPFGLADDVTIWAALEAARLSTYVSSLEGKLEAEARSNSCSR